MIGFKRKSLAKKARKYNRRQRRLDILKVYYKFRNYAKEKAKIGELSTWFSLKEGNSYYCVHYAAMKLFQAKHKDLTFQFDYDNDTSNWYSAKWVDVKVSWD